MTWQLTEDEWRDHRAVQAEILAALQGKLGTAEPGLIEDNRRAKEHLDRHDRRLHAHAGEMAKLEGRLVVLEQAPAREAIAAQGERAAAARTARQAGLVKVMELGLTALVGGIVTTATLALAAAKGWLGGLFVPHGP